MYVFVSSCPIQMRSVHPIRLRNVRIIHGCINQHCKRIHRTICACMENMRSVLMCLCFWNQPQSNCWNRPSVFYQNANNTFHHVSIAVVAKPKVSWQCRISPSVNWNQSSVFGCCYRKRSCGKFATETFCVQIVQSKERQTRTRNHECEGFRIRIIQNVASGLNILIYKCFLHNSYFSYVINAKK